MKNLKIDDRWSISYDPENNDLPKKVKRHGDTFFNEWGYDNMVTAMFYRILELEESIENASQSMSETSPNWEARCHAIMSSLGSDFGGYSEDVPDVGSWHEINHNRNMDQIHKLLIENQELKSKLSWAGKVCE